MGLLDTVSKYADAKKKQYNDYYNYYNNFSTEKLLRKYQGLSVGTKKMVIFAILKERGVSD